MRQVGAVVNYAAWIALSGGLDATVSGCGLISVWRG